MIKFDRSHRHTPRFFTEDWLEIWRPFGAPQRERVEYMARFWSIRGSRVLLYPAGELTQKLLETTRLRLVVVGVGDADPSRQGTTMAGCPVVAPSEIPGLKPDAIFVTTNHREMEICAFLESLDLGAQIFPLAYVAPVPNPIDLWTWDEDFQRRFDAVRGVTLVDERRAFCLDAWAQQALGCPGEGDFAEVGVYRGASARLLAHRLQGMGRALHLFDTFTGMPASDPKWDLYAEGTLADTNLLEVRGRLASFSNIRFYPGTFPKTAGPIAKSSFAFVHIDVDIHQSVLECCEFFYPRVLPGGVMLFDDYGFVECAGALEAVDSFFSGKPEHPCYLPTGQCIVVKQYPSDPKLSKG